MTDLVERIESAHSVWLFDTERHRFRRLPLGADADAPALDSDWEPYFSFDLDEATGAFTVALNEDRHAAAARVPHVDRRAADPGAAARSRAGLRVLNRTPVR